MILIIRLKRTHQEEHPQTDIKRVRADLDYGKTRQDLATDLTTDLDYEKTRQQISRGPVSLTQVGQIQDERCIDKAGTIQDE